MLRQATPDPCDAINPSPCPALASPNLLSVVVSLRPRSILTYRWSVPSTVLYSGTPPSLAFSLPSTGSHGLVLLLQRYSGGAPTRRRPSRFASLSFGSTIPIRHALIRSPGGGVQPALGQGTLVARSPYSPPVFVGSETPASPRFPGCPSALALLIDPGRIAASSPMADGAMLPAGRSKPSAPTFRNVGAPSHSSCFRCLRFAVGIAPRPRKTR